MKTMQTLLMVSALLAAFAYAESQEMQRVADGVYIIPVAGQQGRIERNVGLVEFDEHFLVIDACEEADWETIPENMPSIAAKPARYLAHTHGSWDEECSLPQGSVLLLSPSRTGQTEFRDGNPAIATDVVLEDPSAHVVLRRVSVDGGTDAWTVFVNGSAVLFAGDLVGMGRGSQPLPIDDWISELRRSTRLSPDIVIPGSGPTAGLRMVRDAYGALLRSGTAITDMVNHGRAREDVIETVQSIASGLFPEGAAEHLYDEHVGILPANAFIEEVGLRDGPSPTAQSPGWTPPQTVVVADLWPGRTEQIGLVAPGVDVFVARDREHAAELVEEEYADAILGWLTPEIFERGEELRWISLYSAGIESYLELPGFAESDVVLTNGQRLYANGGAEHVLGMILSLSRRLHTAALQQSERRWDTAPLTGPTPITGDGSELGELRGKTILVAGLGGIGTEVARLAHGIGMRVIATRASRREGPPFVDYVGLANELPYLVWEPDVIVNCLPLTEETEGIFDDQFFRLANSEAFFINIGRGKTVDTDALVRALREGRIAGAALDVTEPEPLPADHELWGIPNVIITPHVGGDSEAHMERIWLLFRENLRRFAVGEPLLSVVNKRRGY